MCRVLRQQPFLWLDVFQAERGWGEQLGGWLISNMTTRMTIRTERGLGPGICDGSVGEDELQKGHGQHLWGGGLCTVGDSNMHCPIVECRQTKTIVVII